MPIDPYRDYTYEEQRTLDLSDLFANGLRGEHGKMRPELQGIGSVAAAIQAQDDGVPLPMVGLMLTNANEKTLLGAQRHPEDLLEELEKRGYIRFASLIQRGIDACQDEADYRTLVRWLGMVRNLLVIRYKASDDAKGSL
jgi:hypothetical protein